MSQFDSESLDNLTKLCRIHCTEEERKQLLGHLQKVLDYVDLLQEVNTTDIEPCHHVVDYGAISWREDEIGETLSRETFLSNAPDQIGGMIRVPPVLKTT